jgi:hypothetical protein
MSPEGGASCLVLFRGRDPLRGESPAQPELAEVGKLQPEGEVDACPHQQDNRDSPPNQCRRLRPGLAHAIYPIPLRMVFRRSPSPITLSSKSKRLKADGRKPLIEGCIMLIGEDWGEIVGCPKPVRWNWELAR